MPYFFMILRSTFFQVLQYMIQYPRSNQIPYKPEDLPASLFKYLTQAHECVNPNCEGVYFDHRLDFIALTV